MKYRGFDGRDYSITVADYTVYTDATRDRSDLHLRARLLLKSMFPCDRILEEVTLPGSRKNGAILYSDFLLPSKSVMVEVQGEQHYKFSSFYHKDKAGFLKSKLRDKDKREWCELNDIQLVELPYNETDDDWRQRIEQRS